MDEKNKRSFFSRFLKRYIIVVYNQGNFKERVSISLTPINLILLLSSLVVVSFICGALLIAFTPIKEAIPGFGNSFMSASKVIHLQNRVDSFEKVVTDYNIYMDSLRKILKGDTTKAAYKMRYEGHAIFRFADMRENQAGNSGSQNIQKEAQTAQKIRTTGLSPLFPPANGYISQHFEQGEGHYAIDIIAKENAPVMAVDDGTVIFAEWSTQTGNVIMLQHRNNLVSIYKHNSVLLKKVGTFVSRGDVIALVGNSGALTTGPHLHFELWDNGNAVDPENYITF